MPVAARRVADAWHDLARPAPASAGFDPAALTGLPTAARRWLTRAIAPGTPCPAPVRLTMNGCIRLGTWRPFTAEQLLAVPHGYIWAARAQVSGVPVAGYDRLGPDDAELRWAIGGRLPIMRGTGADVRRSATGRMCAEIVLNPTAYSAARWSAGPTPDVVIAHIPHLGEDVTLTIDDDGHVTEVAMQRWGDPDGEQYRRHTFGVRCTQPRSFDGVTIPTVIEAGWGTLYRDRAGTPADGLFYQARITGARLIRPATPDPATAPPA